MSIPIRDITNLPGSGVDAVDPARGTQATSRATVTRTDSDGDVERPGETDSANVSSLGSAVTRSAEGARAASSFRPELVNQLKSQVDSGSYHPDMGRTAAVVARALRGMGR